MNTMPGQKCGFISIIGIPNAGKSTLVNALVGAKVSITSRKVQTTRTRVVGIALAPQHNAQMILIDTPGIFSPRKTIEKAMVSTALESVHEGDCVLHIVDASSRDPLADNHQILQHFKATKKPVYLALNKIDRMKRDKLLAIAAQFNEALDYEGTFMISALKSDGLKALQETLGAAMPESAWQYDEDDITTSPMRILAAEITREAILDQLHKEVPYAVLIETETWESKDDGSTIIRQSVTVEKDSQKAILLGKGGNRIKQIGQAAREAIGEMLGGTVHLKLFVKVTPNWQEKAESYQIMGL